MRTIIKIINWVMIWCNKQKLGHLIILGYTSKQCLSSYTRVQPLFQLLATWCAIYTSALCGLYGVACTSGRHYSQHLYSFIEPLLLCNLTCEKRRRIKTRTPTNFIWKLFSGVSTSLTCCHVYKNAFARPKIGHLKQHHVGGHVVNS